MAEVQPPNNGSEGRVSRDVGEEFLKDAGVGDGDLAIQRVEGCSMQGLRRQQKRHQVDITSR